MLRRVGAKARQVDDRIFGSEIRELRRSRAAEQGADELAVPGIFGDDLHRDAMLGLRAAEQLLAIEARALGEMREEIGLERREMIGGHRDIGLAPPARVTRLVVLADELVLGAASGVCSGERRVGNGCVSKGRFWWP